MRAGTVIQMLESRVRREERRAETRHASDNGATRESELSHQYYDLNSSHRLLCGMYPGEKSTPESWVAIEVEKDGGGLKS